MHVSCIARPGIACCPYFYSIFPWFAWDVLFEWTVTHISDSIVHHWQKRHLLIPYISYGSKFALCMTIFSCVFIIELNPSLDFMKNLECHASTEKCPYDSACHELAVASLLERYTPAKICIPTYACRSIRSIFLHLLPYTRRPSLLVMFSTTSSIDLGKTKPTAKVRLAFVSLYCQHASSVGRTRSIFHPLTGNILLFQLGPLPHILLLHQKCSPNGTLKSYYMLYS